MTANENLKLELQLFLGEIMQEIETTYDYFEKQRLKRHKEAIEVLLMISIKS